MSTPRQLSPRPSPPNEQASSRTLHPIYQALDSHNYSKALKLTSSAQQWDVVRALRAHALERSGKRRDALVLLWEVLASNVVLPDDGDGSGRDARDVWSELHRRIGCLSDAEDVVNDGSNGVGVRLLDAVQRLDEGSYAPIPPMRGTDASSASGNAKPSSAPPSSKSSGGGKKGSKGKGGKKGGSGSASAASPPSSSASYPPVTDETVLQTISVTLRVEGLYDTMSEMYHQAVESMMSAKSMSSTDAENYRSVLEEAVCVHLKAVCDCSHVGSLGADGGGSGDGGGGGSILEMQAQLPRLETLLRSAKYHERMQTSSLQLAKSTSQPLHFQWTAISSLWYKESLHELVLILEKIESMSKNASSAADSSDGEMMSQLRDRVLKMTALPSIDDIAPHCAKLKQKMALLPRLAESLSSRMVLQRPAGSVVSESDWDVYVETLLAQGKKEEALEALKGIRCTPMVAGEDGASSSSDVLPQIDDEDTIENHVGSMLPYTQRKKLERCARLSMELGLFEEAEGYTRELLRAFPDQWTYWIDLVNVSVKMESSLPPSVSGDAGVALNEDGWERCRSFANEIIAAMESGGQKHALRGPYLILLELASLKLRHAACVDGENVGLVTQLRDEVCAYGNKFGPVASCCFADVRPYLRVLAHRSSPGGEVSDDVSHLLSWAKEMWTANAQDDSARGSGGGEVPADEFRERRKKIRSFIFAVQAVFGISAECEKTTLELLDEYAPSISQLVTEWRTSLTFLPGVAPKDGGQKEVLPGDEIILFAAQYLQCKAASEQSPSSSTDTPLLLQAASLLEEAIDHSPYNPHLKIAAIGVYSQLNAAQRALSIYQDLGVKQIQLDSCSYLILPTLIKGGLYTSAIKLSSSILRLHGSTSKEVKDYATKSLRNGLMLKAREMVTFQREKMRPSLQLLHSKGLVMDAAALMIPGDLTDDLATQKVKAAPIRLAAEKGLSGSDDDMARAEQIAIDAEVHFNAPAVLHAPAECTSVDDCAFSDNRDMTVNYFEILHQTPHMSQKEVVTDSLRRGHMQGLLTRAGMAVGAANAPKKGKLPKATEETTYRCQSLGYCLSKAENFGKGVECMDIVDTALWDACLALCNTIIRVIHGSGDGSANETLDEREKAATVIVESATQIVQSARTAFVDRSDTECSANDGARVCQLFPSSVTPLFVLLETTSKLFTLFGWGKRKRATKASAGALANLAQTFCDLISDMLQVMVRFRSFGCGDSVVPLLESASGPDFAANSVQRVITEVATSRSMTEDRVDAFLLQMKDSLETFFNDEQ